MSRFARFALIGLASLLGGGSNSVFAQKFDFNQGFDARAEAVASGEEITTQPNLFVFEVEFRPMGILEMLVTDPATGEKKKEHIWYQVYRTVNRQIETPVDDSDTRPQNPEEVVPVPLFVPEFFLIVEDSDDLQIMQDEVIPEAVREISRREKLSLKNSVELVGEIPPAVPRDQKDVTWTYGVATWRGVDPDTDRFTIMANGFSNGYRNDFEVAGEKLRARKTILMKFWRPGDEFDQTDDEIRRDPEAPKPVWIYRPEGVPKGLPSQAVSAPADPE